MVRSKRYELILAIQEERVRRVKLHYYASVCEKTGYYKWSHKENYDKDASLKAIKDLNRANRLANAEHKKYILLNT